MSVVDRRTFAAMLGTSLFTASRLPAEEQKAAERPPNVVLILCDDLGYGDLGCYGNRLIRTPRIDAAAAEGARLTEFYALPTCTPSRAALLTGRYPVRSGLTRVLIPAEHFGIPQSEITLGEALKQRGYRTACIGKWHLGSRPPYRPNNHGFDYFYGLLYSNDMTLPLVNWPTLRLFRNGQAIEAPVEQPTLTRRLTQQAVEFIESKKEGPFFLYLAYTMPHLPWSSSREFAGKSKQGPYGDAVEEIDWSVGQVLKALSAAGIDEQTLFIFASDNGPELVTPKPGGSAGHLRGGKGATWEGGVRVPCIVRWPGRVPPAAIRMGITCVMDLYATIVELAGAELPSSYIIDGRSLVPYLEGRSASPRSTYLYYRGTDLFAVRTDEWKLHLRKMSTGRKGGYSGHLVCNPPELYNLATDPGETNNVQSEHADIVARLVSHATDFRASVIPGKAPPPQWRSVLPRILPGR